MQFGKNMQNVQFDFYVTQQRKTNYIQPFISVEGGVGALSAWFLRFILYGIQCQIF